MFDEIDSKRVRKDKKKDCRKKKDIRDRYGKALKNKLDEELSREYFKYYEDFDTDYD